MSNHAFLLILMSITAALLLVVIIMSLQIAFIKRQIRKNFRQKSTADKIFDTTRRLKEENKRGPKR